MADKYAGLSDSETLKLMIETDDDEKFSKYSVFDRNLKEKIISKKAYKIARRMGYYFQNDEDNFKAYGRFRRDGGWESNPELSFFLLKKVGADFTKPLPTGRTIWEEYFSSKADYYKLLKEFGYDFNQKNADGKCDLEITRNFTNFSNLLENGAILTKEIKERILACPGHPLKTVVSYMKEQETSELDQVVENMLKKDMTPDERKQLSAKIVKSLAKLI